MGFNITANIGNVHKKRVKFAKTLPYKKVDGVPIHSILYILYNVYYRYPDTVMIMFRISRFIGIEFLFLRSFYNRRNVYVILIFNAVRDKILYFLLDGSLVRNCSRIWFHS